MAEIINSVYRPGSTGVSRASSGTPYNPWAGSTAQQIRDLEAERRGTPYNPWAGKTAQQIRDLEAERRGTLGTGDLLNVGATGYVPYENTTVDANAGKYRGADGVWRNAEDNHDYVYGLGKYMTKSTPEPSSGGGGTALSGVQFPQFNISQPDLSWNPTEGQRGTWLEEAIMRAGLQIDPQVQGREQGLSRFRNAAEANRTELNPRYDRMSSAVANVFKNVVDQALVNNAIRRGAAGSGTSSGWLGQERIKAGEAELGQRKGIEGERNQVLNAINSQVLNKEQETSDALQGLEGLRGKQTDVNYADLERLARGDFLQEKQGTFENELQNAIFQGGYSTDQANFLLNKFNSESSASLGQADLALRGRETSLNEALGQYNMRPSAGYSAAPSPYTINVGGQDVPVSTSQYLNYWQNQNSGAETPTEKALREALERL